MENERLLDYVAPCSLLCYTCAGFKDGPFVECSKKLRIYTDGIREFRSAWYAEEDREDWYSFFTRFLETLENFSGGSCPGCLKFIEENPDAGGGCYNGCIIPACVKEHGVNVCGECSEFPCEKAKEFFAKHDAKIIRVWEEGNKRIKEIGINAYFDEKKNVSHYTHYE